MDYPLEKLFWMVVDLLSVLIQQENVQRILMSTTYKNQVQKLQNVAHDNSNNDPHFFNYLHKIILHYTRCDGMLRPMINIFQSLSIFEEK